jgi:hypothetical protein
LESLSGATRRAHALPGMARPRIFDTRDCHGIGKHRLVSPSHLGLVVIRRDFPYHGLSDAGQILIDHFLEGGVGVAVAGDPTYAGHLPKAQTIGT